MDFQYYTVGTGGCYIAVLPAGHIELPKEAQCALDVTISLPSFNSVLKTI